MLRAPSSANNGVCEYIHGNNDDGDKNLFRVLILLCLSLEVLVGCLAPLSQIIIMKLTVTVTVVSSHVLMRINEIDVQMKMRGIIMMMLSHHFLMLSTAS